MTPSRTYAATGLLATLLAGLLGLAVVGGGPAEVPGRPVGPTTAATVLTGFVAAATPAATPTTTPTPVSSPTSLVPADPGPTGGPAAGPAAVKGSVNNSNHQQAYGLPAALAVVLIGGVLSVLVRLLLACPAGRRPSA